LRPESSPGTPPPARFLVLRSIGGVPPPKPKPGWPGCPGNPSSDAARPDEFGTMLAAVVRPLLSALPAALPTAFVSCADRLWNPWYCDGMSLEPPPLLSAAGGVWLYAGARLTSILSSAAKKKPTGIEALIAMRSKLLPLLSTRRRCSSGSTSHLFLGRGCLLAGRVAEVPSFRDQHRYCGQSLCRGSQRLPAWRSQA